LGAGKIIGFSVKVLHYQATPVSLVFLSYPIELIEHNLRKEGRLDCRLPATISIDEEVYGGYISDISPGGCCFVLDDVSILDMKDKSIVTGTFKTMEGQKSYTFTGEFVTRCVSGSNQGLGIRFKGDVALPDGVLDFFSEMADVEHETGKAF